MQVYKLKKGLDISLKGKALGEVVKADVPATWGLNAACWYGFQPRLLVKEGQQVCVGTPLLADKNNPLLCGVSAVSGVVKEVRRGERRKLLAIVVEADGKQTVADNLPTFAPTQTAEETLAVLNATGLGLLLRKRPYDVCIDGKTLPRDIFVSCFNKMPLAAQFDIAVEGREEAFRAGLDTLKSIAKVHVGISPEQTDATWLPKDAEIDVNVFSGPNPAGNVGVQIHHIAPINKGDIVWTIKPENVIQIGEYALSGKLSFTQRIALGGSRFAENKYIEVVAGCPISQLAEIGGLQADDTRIIDGNPLVGATTAIDGFTSLRTTELCAIPTGENKHEVLGWLMPRLKDFSTSRSYFSWLSPKNKERDLDCRIKGGKRHMIMSGEYDKVLPMDIYGEFLIKALITGDIDRQEALGIYEVAPEDFAVAEFVDSSKLELQRIVREGLEQLRKENE